MEQRNLFGGISQLVKIATLLILLECIVSCECDRHHRKRHSHSRHYHKDSNSNILNSIASDSNLNDRKIVIGGKGALAEWTGQGKTTCSSFSSYEEFANSQSLCSSVIAGLNQNDSQHLSAAIKSSLHIAGNESDFWCSCQDKSCSIIYSVDSGAKIKKVFIDALIDAKAEVVILAEYFSGRGKWYQIERLRGQRDHLDPKVFTGLSQVKFTYVHEEFLDVAVLNVTMVLNGGFAIINNFTLMLEEEKLLQHAEPIVEEIVLDKKNDELEREWFEVSCHYSEFFEDFWTFGCPVDADSNAIPHGAGFWFPCRESSCRFLYDGSLQGKPTALKIEGYLQGGSISIAAKSHVLNESSWRHLDTRVLKGPTASVITFDLTQFCNVNVLQILALPERNSIILIDKITVQVDSHQNSSSCVLKAATENTKDLEVSYRTSATARSIKKNSDFVLAVFLFTFLWLKSNVNVRV